MSGRIHVNFEDKSMNGRILKAQVMGCLAFSKNLARIFQAEAGLSGKKGLRVFRGHTFEERDTIGSFFTVSTVWSFPVKNPRTKEEVFQFIKNNIKVSWEDWMKGHFTDQDQKEVRAFMNASPSEELCLYGLKLVFFSEVSLEFKVLNRCISLKKGLKETEILQGILNPEGKKSYIELKENYFGESFSVLDTGYLFINEGTVSGNELFENAAKYVRGLC